MSEAKMDFGTAYYQITDTDGVDAEAKIFSAAIRHMSDHRIAPNFRLLPAADSVMVGTRASEIITNTERARRLILALNYAPPDSEEGTDDNHRRDFFCAQLGDHTFVSGTSNGYEFSYIKERIKKFYRLTTTNSLDTQFRSLQVLPEHAIRFSIRGERKNLIETGVLERVENIDDIVPSVPDETHVFQVDEFSNVKLFVSRADRAILSERAQTREALYFAFSKSAIDCGIRPPSPHLNAHFQGHASKSLFRARIGENVITVNSSSRFIDGTSVPMIATMRHRPRHTPASYQGEEPTVGRRVFLGVHPDLG